MPLWPEPVPPAVEVPVFPGRFDHRCGDVLSAASEGGKWGASFAFRATVGSLWRATPQIGQRLRCAEFSLYGPSRFRQLQCHSPGFSLLRRLGWTFELNTRASHSARAVSIAGPTIG